MLEAVYNGELTRPYPEQSRYPPLALLKAGVSQPITMQSLLGVSPGPSVGANRFMMIYRMADSLDPVVVLPIRSAFTFADPSGWSGFITWQSPTLTAGEGFVTGVQQVVSSPTITDGRIVEFVPLSQMVEAYTDAISTSNVAIAGSVSTGVLSKLPVTIVTSAALRTASLRKEYDSQLLVPLQKGIGFTQGIARASRVAPPPAPDLYLAASQATNVRFSPLDTIAGIGNYTSPVGDTSFLVSPALMQVFGVGSSTVPALTLPFLPIGRFAFYLFLNVVPSDVTGLYVGHYFVRANGDYEVTTPQLLGTGQQVVRVTDRSDDSYMYAFTAFFATGGTGTYEIGLSAGWSTSTSEGDTRVVVVENIQDPNQAVNVTSKSTSLVAPTNVQSNFLLSARAAMSYAEYDELKRQADEEPRAWQRAGGRAVGEKNQR